MPQILHINKEDNVVNTLSYLSSGDAIEFKGRKIVVLSSIPMGHKMAIKPIKKGGSVIKYGHVIGIAFTDIQAGEHVHVHNVIDPISDWKAQFAAPQKRRK